MSKSRIYVENNIKKFGDKAVDIFDKAIDRMGKDIVQIAKIRVPYKSGDLMKSVEVTRQGVMQYKVEVNKVYAGYQERGRRRDGSHVVRQYTTPNTGAHYLRDAGDKVSENALNYLKQANQLIRI